jgi:peroxiredoxin
LGIQPQPANSTAKTQEIGEIVSDFYLPKVDGGVLSIGAILEGKKGAVVVFWSSVCSHCARYDSYLSSFVQSHPEVGLIAVASRSGETQQQIKESAATRKLTFPIVYDANSALAKRWYTQQTPRAFLIDANRVLLYRGAIDNFKFKEDPTYTPYLEPAIEDFLAGRPVRRAETASFGCAIQSVYYTLPNPL